jgi:RNA polymerase sigma factor (sigma-70 family)
MSARAGRDSYVLRSKVQESMQDPEGMDGQDDVVTRRNDLALRAIPIVQYVATRAKRGGIGFRGKVVSFAESSISEKDLFHEGLVSVLENAHKYDPRKSFLTFVKVYCLYGMTAASHTAPVSITRYGWRKNRHLSSVDLADCGGLATPIPDPEEATIERLTSAYIKDRMAALPPKQRDIIERYYFQEQSWPRIAAEYGCSHQAVQQLAAKARKSLEKGLEGLV